MRGNRTLLIVAMLLIILVVIAGGAYLYLNNPFAPETADVSADMTPTPEPVVYTEIIIAMQNIPRGMQISAEDDAIMLQKWPQEHLPTEYYIAIEDVDGKFARMDIPRGLPILPNMIGQPGGMLAASGSSAALFSPEDRVAYAIPMDTQGAVAWALKPGDRVDVIAALSMTSFDPELASESIKLFTYLADDPEMPVQEGTFGHFELLPNGRYAGITGAITNSFTSLIVQLTVQDAIVWHIGIWKDAEYEATTSAPPVDAAADQPADGGGGLLGGGGAAAPAEATPLPEIAEFKDVEPVTLLVTREDALILKYLYEMGADLDLVLRPAGFTGTVIQTQPVWFRYILDKYQLPDGMPTDVVAPVGVRPLLELPSLVTPTPEE